MGLEDKTLSPVGQIRADMLTSLSEALDASMDTARAFVSQLSSLLGVGALDIDPATIMEAPEEWMEVKARAQRSLLQSSASSGNQSACGPGPSLSNSSSSNSSALGIISASAPSTTCLTSVPAATTVLLATIMGMLENMTQSGANVLSMQSSMSSVVSGLGDKFDNTDTRYLAHLVAS